MIKATFGITQEPFNQDLPELLPQQQAIIDIIKVHSQHGGFNVIIGGPGVGKTILRTHLENLEQQRDTVVVSCSRTLHSYLNVLKQLAESFKLDVSTQHMEKALINAAFSHVRENKSLYTLIDEAHLLDIAVLRKLRLMFDRFPRKHNLVLLGQTDLMYYLSMTVNHDIKSRITYSANLLPLNDQDLEAWFYQQLENVRLGANTFDQGAVELIIRSAEGNLRLCSNLGYSSLVEACRENKKTVAIGHVNHVLIQPHWCSHEDLIKQQAKTT